MLAFEHGIKIELGVIFQASVASELIIRGLTREGPFTFKTTTTSSGTTSGPDFALPDFPIMVEVSDNNGAFRPGECYVKLFLRINGDTVMDLGGGYIYNQRSISYPRVQNDELRPGGGAIKIITGSNPAAGSEISVTVPNGRLWKILSLRAQLVAAAVAVSRRPHLVINDGTNDIVDAFGTIDQTTGQTRNYTFAEFGALPDETDDNDILVPIPSSILLPESFVIKTQTTNLDAGDNWGAPILLVEEYLNNPFI